MDTLTLNLVKCKRPASVLLDDMDFLIEAGTGRLKRLENGVLPYRLEDNIVQSETEQLTMQEILTDW